MAIEIFTGSVLFLTLALAVFVYFKGDRKRLQKVFLIMIAFMVFWAASSFAADISRQESLALFFSRLAIVGPFAWSFTFFYFCFLFTSENRHLPRKVFLILVVAVLLPALFTFTDFNVQSVTILDGRTDFVPGFLYSVLDFYLLAFGAAGIYFVYKKLTQTRDAITKFQLSLFLSATTVRLIIGLLTNSFLPAVFGYTQGSIFGPPIAVLLFTGIAGYAVLRYRLLDIKVVFRRVFFPLILAVLTILFLSIFLFSHWRLTDFFIIFSSFGSVMIGVVTFFKAKKNSASISFLAFSVSIASWVLLNFLIDASNSHVLSLWFTKLSAFINSFIPIFLLTFSYNFPSPFKFLRSKFIFYLLPFSFLFAFLSVATANIVFEVNSLTFPVEVIYGKFFWYYAAYILLLLLTSLVILGYKYFFVLKGFDRQRVGYVFFGAGMMVIVALLTNLVLPVFGITKSLTRIGPSFAFFFVLLTSYSILRTRLFDIKAAFQRSWFVLFSAAIGLVLLGVFLYRFPGFSANAVILAVFILCAVVVFVYRRTVVKIFKKIFPEKEVDFYFFFDATRKQLGATTLVEFFRKVHAYVRGEWKSEITIYLHGKGDEGYFRFEDGRKKIFLDDEDFLALEKQDRLG